LNLKYGNVKNACKHIFITSVQSQYDIYSEYNQKNARDSGGLLGSNINPQNGNKDEPRKQWLKRFKK